MSRRVVVTGLGFATCLGRDAATVLGALRELRHGIVLHEPFDDPSVPVSLAAPVPGFRTDSPDAEDWTFPENLSFRLDQLRALSPNALYATYALRQAIAAAGLEAEAVAHPRTGLFTASAGSAMLTHHHIDRMKRVGPSRCSPLGIVASIAGTLNFNLVPALGIQGASAGFISACASSGHALGYAFDEIALGRQDCMLVVGAEDFTPETILPFASMRVLTLSRDPDTASRPFDRGRDGFVGTGGSVAMVLEEESVARARGAEIYAGFSGWGQSTDGTHMAIAHPEGAGLARAMESALAAAAVAPDQVDYVNAHATSTPMGDASECRALKRVFGTGGKRPAVSSTKALTGHALSLSSIMEAAFSVLALHHRFVPGAAHLVDPDPEAAGLFLPRESLDEAPHFVVSNSSGFGGANVVMVFARHS
ncbi:MAG: beta-ketoacyl-[acyl-carrier-protein] synthase family protein [Opitutales bacterium]|nr:beta-ketoacyl-[acyl-carrier-protein] synthase family protein [Opitutales bacterium]